MGIKKEERVRVENGRYRRDLNREEESEWGLSKRYRAQSQAPPPSQSGNLVEPGTPCLSEVGKGREQDKAGAVWGIPSLELQT